MRPRGDRRTNATNWDEGVTAVGTDSAADFDLTAFAIIPAKALFTLHGPRAIGHLFFTDDGGSDNGQSNTGTGEPLPFRATVPGP